MLKLSKVNSVKGELRVPSDKSISHRAIILSGIARGVSLIRHWLSSQDTLATLEMLRSLGVEIQSMDGELRVKGRDYVFREPDNLLDARNSGTTARLMLGVLSTQPFFSVITGDESLRRRPMLRVVEPLKQMGANLDGREGGNKLPICVRGGKLVGINIFNKKSSAQVKSSLLLAGLRAEGYTEVAEPVLSRDHTERMLKAFGVDVIQIHREEGHIVKLMGGQSLTSTEVFCPADPSSASFFVALAALLKGSEILLRDVLINPTRDGFFRKLRQMGANVSYENIREISGEPIADVAVTYSGRLKAVDVLPEEVPSMIDELPILAVVMALSEGVSRVRGAQELRVKESDRIKAMVQGLRMMGAKVEEYEDGFEIEGLDSLKGATIKTYGDHRIAMSFSIAGLVTEGETIIDEPSCVAVSYPEFYKDLEYIIKR